MAEGDIHVYQTFKSGILRGTFDLTSDTIKASLVSGHTKDEDTHSVWGDVSADEITDGSYTAQTLTGLSVTESGTGSGTAVKGKWDAADVTFASLTGTDPNYLILWDDTPTSPADPLIAAMELTTTTNGGDYAISWNANGIVRVS